MAASLPANEDFLFSSRQKIMPQHPSEAFAFVALRHCRVVGRICVSWVRIRSILPRIYGNSLRWLFRGGHVIGVVCDGAFCIRDVAVL